MTSVMTYQSLVQDIQTYAERDDEPFIAQVPNFIALAENRLASEIKALGYLRVVEGLIGGPVLQKPTRWRKTKNFSVNVNGERRFIFERTYEYCRVLAGGTTSGIPRYYSDYDYEHFYIAPAPVVPAPFELSYYERPDPLSENSNTSWITIYAPQLLLYASLLEAQPFLKTSERIAEFQGLYDRALQAIIKEDQERVVDASS